MSVRATVELAAEVDRPIEARIAHRYIGKRPAGTLKSAADFISKLTAYFPSEALGMYLVIIGLALPDTSAKRTIWYLFGLAITLAFVWIYVSRSSAHLDAGKKAWLYVIAGVSFLTWAAAIPSSPWLEVSAQAPRGAAIVAVVLTGFLPEIAKALKLRLPWGSAGP